MKLLNKKTKPKLQRKLQHYFSYLASTKHRQHKYFEGVPTSDNKVAAQLSSGHLDRRRLGTWDNAQAWSFLGKGEFPGATDPSLYPNIPDYPQNPSEMRIAQ